MTNTLDTLAALRILPGRGDPVRHKLDSDGSGVLVTLPDPEYLARTLGTGAVFDLPDDVTVYRTGSSGVVLEDGSALAIREHADQLVSSWSTLPSRVDEGPVFRDLRLVSTEAPLVARDYALRVLREARRLLEHAPRRDRERPRRERTPDVERKRKSRECLRRDEEESSRWWLAGWLSGWDDEEEAPAPGTEVVSTALYAEARARLEEVVEEYVEDVTDPAPGSPSWLLSLAERLEEWAERAEDDGLPLRPRVPGSRRFYAVANEVLGAPRVGRARTKVYTVPNTRGGGMFYTDEEIREAAEVREIVARLREQRDRLQVAPAATGTDGRVVDFAARRGGR